MGWGPEPTPHAGAANSQPVQATEWRLVIDSGEFVEGTKIFFPTPTP